MLHVGTDHPAMGTAALTWVPLILWCLEQSAVQEGRGLLGGIQEAGTAQLAKKSIHGPEIAPLSSTER